MGEVNDLVAEVIREVEWITVDFGGSCGVVHYCPMCQRDKVDGHGRDCRMDKFVKMLGGSHCE